jgi:2-oxoglutarate dehydrogenase dihydrolipoamide succinyltransferase (E2 component)
MSTKVIMPQMGESVVEGKVSKWLVKEGDPIEADQPIAEVSTDKVDVEIPSPSGGTLEKILVPEGETVSVGTEIALIQDGKAQDGKDQAAPPPAQSVPPPTPEVKKAEPAREKKEGKIEGKIEEKVEIDRLSPVVKRLAEEYKIDLQKISGTGIGGRITKQDLLDHIDKGTPQKSASAAPAPTETEDSPKQRQTPPPSEKPVQPAEGLSEYKIPRVEPKEGDQVVPFSRLRKMIAEHMVYSKRTAAHVTTVSEVDLVRVVRLREEKKSFVKEQTGSDLTFLPFVIAAAIRAIPAYPTLNASVAGQSLIIRKEIHMGIAVETEKGLMVPVIRNAGEKSIVGLSRSAAELARKAREGTLAPDEITGGTFTVSNPGKNGNLFGTPIIFQPQVGILRMGELIKRPVVIEADGTETIGIHPMMYLSLTYDHRVIDGATGNLFLHRVKEILEKGEFSF